MIEVRVPDEQEGTKAVVRAWLKQVGDAVAVNDPWSSWRPTRSRRKCPRRRRGCWRRLCSIRMPRRCRGRCWGGSAPTVPRRRPGSERRSLTRPTAAPAGAPGPRPSPGRTRMRNAPLALGAPRLPAAWHRPRAASRAPAAAGGSRARMSTARSLRPPSASASPRPPSRASSRRATSRTTGCGSRSPRIWSARSARRRMSPRCSRPISRRSPRTRRRWRPRASSSATPPTSSRPRPKRWRSRRRSTAAGKRTASPSRRRSTSASAPRWAKRAWSCRWSRTPAALSLEQIGAQARRPHQPRPRRAN